MKIGCVADLHFGKRMNQSATCDRDREVWDQLRSALAIFRDREVDGIAVLGDIANSNHPTIQTNAYIRSMFSVLHEAEVPCVVIPGNHDYTHTGFHTLEPFHDLYPDQIRVADGNVLWEGDVLVVPWQPHEDLVACMAGPEKVVLTHAMFAGGSVPSGYVMRDALIPPSEKFIVSGDIHGAQRFRSNRSWVVYPGSLTQVDYGERGQEKGAFILDTDNPRDDSEWVEVPGHYRYEHEVVGSLDEIPEHDWERTILDLVLTDVALLDDAWAFIEERPIASVRRVAVEEQIVRPASQPLESLGYLEQYREYAADAPPEVVTVGEQIIGEVLG